MTGGCLEREGIRHMQALGIDIGGTGIKGAPVDLATGKLLADRKKIATPHPATPDAVTEVVKEVAQSFGWTGVTGATFPGVVIGGTIRSAANVDKSWIGTDAAALFGKAIGTDVAVLNDADAAGIAEMTFGAGVGVKGSVLMLTFGTGVGSALFTDGVLVRNTEFGHIEIRGKDAEKRASEHAKIEHELGLEGMDRAGVRVPAAHRGADVPRPDHRRRRDQQGIREVGAAC